ncbi:uncharacterized protein LOC110985114 [Acanthaster planci]|uniref:Uncharacterized protein LOC110985114 n=1 Tax=Acanthaster planci TaxID=133434 RepID=A0A8B7Z7F7_ACAPL|nr:uncharacterized protein LOC110985114 [Acanthaster planci]
MGSPISPVLANIFMEEFETSSLLTANCKPTIWPRYVDDTFIIWPHGQDHLQEFLEYLNKQHSTIKFTMEQEQDGHLSVLNVQLSRNPDGTLHHRVHRKLTHTDRYLHQRSFRHPAIKTCINRTLVYRAYEICDQNNCDQTKNCTTSSPPSRGMAINVSTFPSHPPGS